MLPTREEILKLHELSERKQIEALHEAEIINGYFAFPETDSCPTRILVWYGESLADCAFRLRDEVGIGEWAEACRELYNHIPTHPLTVQSFWRFKAQPINWIQAALRAKANK